MAMRIMWTNENGSGDANTVGFIVKNKRQASQAVREYKRRDYSGYNPPILWSEGEGWYNAGGGGVWRKTYPVDAGLGEARWEQAHKHDLTK